MVVNCGCCGLEVEPQDRDVVLIQRMERVTSFGEGGPDTEVMDVGLPAYFHGQCAPRGPLYRLVE